MAKSSKEAAANAIRQAIEIVRESGITTGVFPDFAALFYFRENALLADVLEKHIKPEYSRYSINDAYVAIEKYMDSRLARVPSNLSPEESKQFLAKITRVQQELLDVLRDHIGEKGTQYACYYTQKPITSMAVRYCLEPKPSDAYKKLVLDTFNALEKNEPRDYLRTGINKVKSVGLSITNGMSDWQKESYEVREIEAICEARRDYQKRYLPAEMILFIQQRDHLETDHFNDALSACDSKVLARLLPVWPFYLEKK